MMDSDVSYLWLRTFFETNGKLLMWNRFFFACYLHLRETCWTDDTLKMRRVMS